MSNSCDPVDCSPPSSFVHGISQARILERVAIFFYRRYSQFRDWTHIPCVEGGLLNYRHILYHLPTREAPKLPYDPAILLLGIYPEKATIQNDTCTPVFITALFTIARTWKEPRCPSTDEWIKKLWYIYNGILHSHKKEHIWVSANEVNEPRAYYTEWSKSERKKWIFYMNAYIGF